MHGKDYFMDSKTELRGHLIALATVFIWGTTFISTKILLRSFAPIEILFLRFAMGLISLWIIHPRRMKIQNRKHELYFAAAGLCGITLYYLLENISLTYTLASNVGVIISVAPFFTGIFARLFLGEKLKMRFFAGFVVAVAGIVLISFGGSELKLNPLGDILAVLAAMVWAAYSVLMKKIGGFSYNTIEATRRVFSYGLLLMLPALLVFGFHPDVTLLVQPVNVLNLLFLGLGASALCFVTWNWAVKLLGAVRTSAYIYLVPVVTIAASVMVLHETITTTALLGTGLTLAGLLVSESGGRKRTKERIRTEGIGGKA